MGLMNSSAVSWLAVWTEWSQMTPLPSWHPGSAQSTSHPLLDLCSQSPSPSGHSPHTPASLWHPVLGGSPGGVSPFPVNPPSASRPGLGVQALSLCLQAGLGSLHSLSDVGLWSSKCLLVFAHCFRAASWDQGRGRWGGASSRDRVLAFLRYCEHLAHSRASAYFWNRQAPKPASSCWPWGPAASVAGRYPCSLSPLRSCTETVCCLLWLHPVSQTSRPALHRAPSLI